MGKSSYTIISFAIAIFILCQTAIGEPIQDTLESPEWFLNGNPAPSSATIEVLTKEILPSLCSEAFSWENCRDNWKWQIDTVGQLANHIVIDLMCTIEFRSYQDTTKYEATLAIKGTALEVRQGRYRLVFAMGSYPNNLYFEASRIKTVGTRQVLSGDTPQSGSGGYHIYGDWVWDSKMGVPLKIDYDPKGLYTSPVHAARHKLNAYKTVARKSGTETKQVYNYEKWPFFSFDGSFEVPLSAMSPESLIGQYGRLQLAGGNPRDSVMRSGFLSQIDTIGYLQGKAIVNIAYQFVEGAVPVKPSGRIVGVAEELGKCKPLYVGVTSSYGFFAEDCASLVLQGDTIVYAKGWKRIDGKSFDNYWVWPKESPAPVPLFQEWVLSETLTRIAPKYLPLGLTARIHKGKWDFERLSYETYTWKKDDPDNAPSGGKLFIQFGLKNHRLQPLDITFDSTAVAPPSN